MYYGCARCRTGPVIIPGGRDLLEGVYCEPCGRRLEPISEIECPMTETREHLKVGKISSRQIKQIQKKLELTPGEAYEVLEYQRGR